MSYSKPIVNISKAIRITHTMKQTNCSGSSTHSMSAN